MKEGISAASPAPGKPRSAAAMKRNHFIQRLALVALFASSFSHAQSTSPEVASALQMQETIQRELGPAPQGFLWQVHKTAVFPKPTTWHEQQSAGSSAGIPFSTYAASPERFSQTQMFEMGLTVQIINGSQRLRNVAANQMALVYLKPFLDAHKKEDILVLSQDTQGSYERTLFRYQDAPPGMTPIIVHKMILANNSTDSVHVFTFESPVSTWERNWAAYGTPFMRQVNILSSTPNR